MDATKVFTFFGDIYKIPRESGHEEKIIAYLQKFAKDRNLNCMTDDAGNVLITKPATAGMEGAPTVILQSHSDMVCEKNSDSNHDFEKDPIKVTEENGWLIAKETTLGADCGIGIAAELAILDSDNIIHGPIEALFTTEEETGLTGAKSLAPGFLKGDILINLDSEDEGELFIGCAGGIDTTGRFVYTPKNTPKDSKIIKFGFYGATGGHSGDDIEKNRANANQLLLRFLFNIYGKFEVALCHIDGGNKRNAIAREAYATLAVNPGQLSDITSVFERISAEAKIEYLITDPGLYSKTEIVPATEYCVDNETFGKIIYGLYGLPHGVLAMSQEIPGFVETSTNLASIKMAEKGVVTVCTSQRSSINSAKLNAAGRIEAILRLAGAEVEHETDYPGWQPKLDSRIMRESVESYKRLFGKEPIVRAIHAGLECGILIDKFPKLDIISFGPTIKGAHAPGEKLEIATVDKFWILLLDILKKLK